tara:strand:+ start:374 stop:898 length:525 start_codon:yes stop_codon:yes gene_type:complete
MKVEEGGLSIKFYLLIQLICSCLILGVVYLLTLFFPFDEGQNQLTNITCLTLILVFIFVHNALVHFSDDEDPMKYDAGETLQTRDDLFTQGLYLSEKDSEKWETRETVLWKKENKISSQEVLEMVSGRLLRKDGKPFTGNAFGPDKKLRNYRNGMLVEGISGFFLKWWHADRPD